jgi:dihydropteroate synthase
MLGKSTAFSINQTLNCRGKLLDLNEPKIMGILNLTPDSFFDGGRNLKDNFFLKKAEELVKGGAAILDLGAATSKPGSLLIDSKTEWAILEQPLKKLKKLYSEIIFSVDTYNAETAQKAADLGILAGYADGKFQSNGRYHKKHKI